MGEREELRGMAVKCLESIVRDLEKAKGTKYVNDEIDMAVYRLRNHLRHSPQDDGCLVETVQ